MVKLKKLCEKCGEVGAPERPVETEYDANGEQKSLTHRDCR